MFLDALGTLVELEPPWLHLGGGDEVARAERAFRAEMAYYRAHCHEGRDPASLAGLRRRSAAALSGELGRPVEVEEMMAAIRFRAFADAPAALAALRERGQRLVVVSNWDFSLPEVLARVGLDGAIDGVVSSAGAGARKPDPAIFGPALELAGCQPAEALHVGDSAAEDLAAARAAGIRALLLDRSGGGDIASLAEVEGHL